MHVPTAAVGVTTISALVAISSVLVFVITKTNAESSINDVSHKLSSAKMETVLREIRFKLQKEPVDAIMASKSDIEMGELRFDSSSSQWVRRASHFFVHSGFYKLYMILPGNRSLGDIYGMGMIVDGAGLAIVVNDPPNIHLEKGYNPENGTWIPGTAFSAPVNLSGRPYVTMYSEGPNHVQHLLANTPRWTEIVVSVNPNLKGGGGPFVTLSVPVFRTTEPIPEDFIGVTAVSIYLSFFSLHPYLLSNQSHLLLIDDLGMLVGSTDVEITYYQNGTLPNGAPNYLRHTLLSTNVTLYHSLYWALPNLGALVNDEEYFTKFDHNGDVMWLEMRAVYHSNLKWYLISITPEREFFQKIYDSNKNTLIIVVVLIVASVVVGAAVTLVFTMRLTRLALAFDHVANMRLDHDDVNAIGGSHCLFELNSLYRGFWLAVDTVKQVQAFLPDVDESDESAADKTTTATASPSARSISMRSSNTKGHAHKTNLFALGLRSTRHATSLTVHLRSFAGLCHANLDEAISTHKRVFPIVAEQTKASKGVVSYLEGSRIVVTWNTAKNCPPSTSKQCSLTLGLELYVMVQELAEIDVGINIGFTIHGILGSTQQRFNVVGSELVDVSTHLALGARRLGLTPSVYASAAVVYEQHAVTCHMVNKSVTQNDQKVSVYWVADKVQAAEEEWMYQLSQQEEQKDPFLNSYWAAVEARNYDKALLALHDFGETHQGCSTLVEKLASDTNLELRYARGSLEQ